MFLEDGFGFCKSFKKVTKNLAFYLIFKTANLQKILFTSKGDNINVTTNSLHLYITNLKPSFEIQLKFIEATQKNYKLSFDGWYTESRLISDLLVQHDTGSAQQVKSPKYLTVAHQARIRSDTPNKKIIKQYLII